MCSWSWFEWKYSPSVGIPPSKNKGALLQGKLIKHIHTNSSERNQGMVMSHFTTIYPARTISTFKFILQNNSCRVQNEFLHTVNITSQSGTFLGNKITFSMRFCGLFPCGRRNSSTWLRTGRKENTSLMRPKRERCVMFTITCVAVVLSGWTISMLPSVTWATDTLSSFSAE